ncbi:MAG: hypothetical protein ACRCV9_09755 [Burkholderiaceae bacterium]
MQPNPKVTAPPAWPSAFGDLSPMQERQRTAAHTALFGDHGSAPGARSTQHWAQVAHGQEVAA